MGHPGLAGVQMTPHRHSRGDDSVRTELPGMDVLVPAALELCRYRQAGGVEVVAGIICHDDGIGVERGVVCGSIPSVWGRVLKGGEGSTSAASVKAVFVR